MRTCSVTWPSTARLPRTTSAPWMLSTVSARAPRSNRSTPGDRRGSHVYQIDIAARGTVVSPHARVREAPELAGARLHSAHARYLPLRGPVLPRRRGRSGRAGPGLLCRRDHRWRDAADSGGPVVLA